MSTDVASGGYLVPTDFATQLIEALKAFGGMRDVAEILPTTSGELMNYPGSDGTSEVGEIVGENAAATGQDIAFTNAALQTFKYSSKKIAIPWELIVSGKPVPPRPSPRLRVSVRDAELHTAALVGIETTPLGEWQLRYEPAPVGRIRNRFNPCLGLGDPGLGLAEAAAYVEGFYVERDRPPRIQVELGSTAEDALHDLGWEPVPGRDSHFLLASLARVRRVLGRGSGASGRADFFDGLLRRPRAAALRSAAAAASRGR